MEFEETLLPPLNKNIMCGNSLIEFDANRDLFDLENRDAIRQFSFRAAFPSVFQTGGFDAIVGNPPYIRVQVLSEVHPATARYVKSHYETAKKGGFDLYSVFVERGMGLLNTDGVLGFIVPNKFHKTDYGETLRGLISDARALSRVIDFGSSQVFQATTYTCLLFLSRSPSKIVEYGSCGAVPSLLETLKLEKKSADEFSHRIWSFAPRSASSVFEKIEAGTSKLLDLPATMSRGSSTGADAAFLIAESENEIEEGILRTPLFASDFGRFEFRPKSNLRIIFPYENTAGKYTLIEEKKLKAKFPKAYRWLCHHKKTLEARAQYKDWYAYSAPRNLIQHDRACIAVPLLANQGLAAAIPSTQSRLLCPMASGGFTIEIDARCGLAPSYVLGLLNSSILFWYLRNISNVFRGGWITCTKQYYGVLPIKQLDLVSMSDKLLHDKVVNIVDNLSANKERLYKLKTDQQRENAHREIEYFELELDAVAAEIYGLTEAELDLVRKE